MINVVDENVLVVANDLTRRSLGLEPKCPEASDDCGIKCAETLRKLIEKGRVGLDDGEEVLKKYKNHCSFSGQPGIGDAFLRAVFERGYMNNWAQRVVVRDEGNIMLPQQFIDSGFDNDDHLWVAVAYNSDGPACIINAVDSDYANHADDCAAIGIVVKELCS